ncbi:DUF4221 family protein [Algoriphagus sp.]|uniref:DUF4221 family protein n=1 Tax=Algoriphagus sp. TaxID=1872435 RepID=UPI003F7023A6
MKTLLTISVLALLSACSGKETGSTESGNILENLSYSVDTVVVDSGEDIFDLSGLVHLSTQVKNPNFIYQFDEKQSKIHKIDLDSKSLISTFEFEKEGPDGIGKTFSGFEVLSGERFLIASFESQGVFDASGTKEFDLNVSDYFDPENDYQEELLIPYELRLSPDGKYAYVLAGDFFEGIWYFARLDLVNKTSRVWEMPELLSSKDFTIMLTSETFDLRAEDVHLNKLKDGVAVTVGSSSSVYAYYPSSDSLQLIKFPHTLTAAEKSGTYPPEVSSQNGFEKVVAAIDSEISFDALAWDSSTSRYFRFASRKPTIASEKEEVFLYAYDAGLKLLGEQKVDGLTSRPTNYFFKDGKLYSYVNVEDELGFAVFTFDF